MSDSKAPAIRARLRYASVAEFKTGYSKFVSTGGMFIPVPESKLKPVGTEIRFQFMLNNGETVLLGKGRVLQIRKPDITSPNAPTGLLVKFSKLSKDSKQIIDEIVSEKNNRKQIVPEIVEEVRQNYPTPSAPLSTLRPTNDEEDKTILTSLPDLYHQKKEVVERDEDISDDQTVVGTLENIIGNHSQRPVNDELEADDKTVVGTLDDIFRSQSPNLVNRLLEGSEASESEAIDLDSEVALGLTPMKENTPDDLIFSAATPPQTSPMSGVSTTESAESLGDVFAPKKPTSSNIRVLSYDDMSAVDASEVDFGFSGEESEIDDMFDDLFGISGDTSFFDDVLGGSEPEASPSDILSTPKDEIPLAGVISKKSSTHLDLSARVVRDAPSVDDSLSMEDAFESESEDDIFAGVDAPLKINNDFHEEEKVDENPFRADPPSIELSESDLADAHLPEENSPLDEIFFENEVDKNDGVLDAQIVEESDPIFEAFDAPHIEEIRGIEKSEGELDSLLGNLETDSPLGRSFDLSHEPQMKAIEEDDEDPESLEALLALANKDIKTQKQEAKEEIDILDQLLGDDLPPLPDADSSFTMPPPESSGKKKGLFSKLFGKD